MDHGAPDITWLMARAIGRKLYDAYGQKTDLGGRNWLGDRDVTVGALSTALAERKPALVVTTRHG